MRPRRAILLPLLALALAGCRSAAPLPERAVVRARPAAEPQATGAPQPIESRLDAVNGKPLVVPLRVDPARAPLAVEVRADDGRRVLAPVAVLVARPGERGLSSWLGPPRRWEVLTEGREPDGPALAVAIVDVPPGTLGLWFGGVRTPVNPLPNPGTLLEADAAAAWASTAGEAAGDATLLALARADRFDPLRRWRWTLLTEGLAAALPLRTRSAEDPDAVELLATQTEARWQVALAWLAAQDAGLAQSLRRRLAAVVRVEGPWGSAWAPAYPTGDVDVEALGRDLVDPRLSPLDRAARAAAFLTDLPPAAAWVMDDAGLRAPGEGTEAGGALSTAIVANLSARGVLAYLDAPGAATDPGAELTPLAPWTAGPVVGDWREEAARRRPALEAHAGTWSARLDVLASPLPVRPPGLEARALLPDWTLAGVLAGSPDPATLMDPGWATAAMVYREGPTTEGPGAWRVLVECRFDPAVEGTDSIEVWLGPSRAPAAVVRAQRDGPAAEGDDAPRVRREGDRWSAWVTIPARAIEPAGLVRIGLVRVDARGVRSAWPRPMLPWQTEPGRVALDLTPWGSPETPARRPR